MLHLTFNLNLNGSKVTKDKQSGNDIKEKKGTEENPTSLKNKKKMRHDQTLNVGVKK